METFLNQGVAGGPRAESGFRGNFPPLDISGPVVEEISVNTQTGEITFGPYTPPSKDNYDPKELINLKQYT